MCVNVAFFVSHESLSNSLALFLSVWLFGAHRRAGFRNLNDDDDENEVSMLTIAISIWKSLHMIRRTMEIIAENLRKVQRLRLYRCVILII